MAVTSFTYLHSTVYKDLTADTTGELLAAGTPTLFSVRIDNTANTTASYFKIYDKATAPANDASDTPAIILKVPASDSFEFSPNMGLGHIFTAGIGIRCVTEAGVAGVTNPTNPVLATILTD